MPDSTNENVGYLTVKQFDRLQWAVNDAAKLVPWWRVAGYVRSDDADGVRSPSFGHPLGIPPTWLAAEEVNRLLVLLNRWPELSDAANDWEGAVLALAFTREVERAKKLWPFEDRPHRVRFVGCQSCDAPMLRYLPPRRAGDGIVVKCSVCGAVMDENMFAFAVRLIEGEHERRRLDDVARRAGVCAPVEGDGQAVGS